MSSSAEAVPHQFTKPVKRGPLFVSGKVRLVGVKTTASNLNLVPRLSSFDPKKNIDDSRNIGFACKHITNYLEIDDCLVYT